MKLTWKGRKHTSSSVIESEKRFASIGRDITHINQFNQLEDMNPTALSPAVESQPATMKLEPDANICFAVLGKSH